MSGVVLHLGFDLDLIYSPDDEGWYFSEYPSGRTSELYPSRALAVSAWRGDKIEWGMLA